ncbi:MAG TPA: ABC transporter ATP-binding protein, partial [Gammaproteobacteria bacterium]|nr:ABC transporter ATP-binding protein [Gammaproteobacteria bacterium]
MIELDHIHRLFQVGEQPVHALNNVSLAIEAGEYLSIMGPSGSGKSTLLHIIGLLDRADRGRYRLNGRDTTELSDAELARLRQNTVGFVFQFFHLVPRLSAYDNVALPLVLAGVAPTERKKRVDAALAAVGMSHRAQHRPDQLSGGQRQRVAIARATIMRPSVLLADEPTGNLDRSSGLEVIEQLESLNADGITLIVVTHNADLGRRARRQLQMVDGALAGDTGIGG